MTDHGLPPVETLASSILSILSDWNGSGTDSQVTELLYYDYDDLTEEQLGVLAANSSTKSEFAERIDVAKELLLRADYLSRSQQGEWKIIKPKELHNPELLQPALLKAKQEMEAEAEQERIRNQPPKEYSEDRIAEFREAVLAKLKKMNPLEFERLTAKLLRLCGFDSFPGKGTGDGGIDGTGFYKVNGILTYKVIIQCKRYDQPIQPSFVRDLRGVVSNKADKGLFVTTSTFTRAAIEEARNHPLIDLIDGHQFVDLMIQHNLGVNVSQRQFYKFDDHILEGTE